MFDKLWSTFYLSKTVCRARESAMHSQGQGHNEVKFSILSPLHIFLLCQRFSLNFSNEINSVQTNDSRSRSQFKALNFESALYLLNVEKIFNKLCHYLPH